MDVRQTRNDVQAGRLTPELVERVLDEVERLQQTVRRLTVDNERLRQRLAAYEPEISREANPSPTPGDTSAQHYSLDAEAKRRQRRRRRKKSPGRRPTHLKFADAHRYEDVVPTGIGRASCQLVRERAVWRLANGQAVLIGCRVYRAPGGAEPRIPGVTPRCEYGLEILVVLAYLVYVIGISLDKACALLAFFCRLPLTKGQADALLRQLAQHWESEYDILCDLIAHAAVVYMDETGWKIGSAGCSLWTFATKLQRVFLFGCHKDAATLDEMLPPDVFAGIGVSDDAAVYRHRFVRAQKCWAHLLRKAIKLALLYPRKKRYQRFLDHLLALYNDAKRVAADGRLGDEGRKHQVAELEGRLCELCAPYERDSTAGLKPHERDFANLAHELLERLRDEELFTFVLVPEVESTNNYTERLQRGPALERKAGRTSKTPAGAQRRSVIVSVLESLRANLEQFTLAGVLAEVQRWLDDGISLFAEQWQAFTAAQPAGALDTT